MPGSVDVNGGITFQSITSAMTANMSSSEANVSALLASGGSSTTDLLNMQTALQQFTLASNLISTITKDFGDALKSIVQKSA